MSYIQQSLGVNEAVHYVARFPTIRYVLAWLALSVGLAIGLLLTLHGASIVGLLVSLSGVAVFSSILYQVWTTEIAVTNLRLIYKRGLFQRIANDLQLRAIEEVRIRQNFWGRVFNYGNVEFRGTGVDDLRLPALSDPVPVQKAVQEAIGAHQEATELPGTLSMPTSNEFVNGSAVAPRSAD
jgi:uncharacterized membrane protein YdbT with pleckstrin-like domain